MLTEEMRNYVLDKVRSSSGVRKHLKAILLKDLEFSKADVVDATLSIKNDRLKLRVVYVDDNSKYQRSVFYYEPDTLYYQVQPLLAEEDTGLVHNELCNAYEGIRKTIDDYRTLGYTDICDPIINDMECVSNAICRIGDYLHLRPWQRPER
jgi:hypothetical protein